MSTAAMKPAAAHRRSGAYSRFSHLAGGVFLFAIGTLLLQRPEWRMFG